MLDYRMVGADFAINGLIGAFACVPGVNSLPSLGTATRGIQQFIGPAVPWFSRICVHFVKVSGVGTILMILISNSLKYSKAF